MSRDRERHRERKKQDEEPIVYNGIVREDCPCVKTSCKRYKLCDLCREHHYHPKKSHGFLGTPNKKMPPYCERDAAKKAF